MKTIIMSIMIFCGALVSTAQDNGDAKKFDQYSEQLELNDEQMNAFKEVVVKYDLLLDKIDVKNKSEENVILFNRTLKQEVSEVYHLLPREIFNTYKEVKIEIEPNKQFIKQ